MFVGAPPKVEVDLLLLCCVRAQLWVPWGLICGWPAPSACVCRSCGGRDDANPEKVGMPSTVGGEEVAVVIVMDGGRVGLGWWFRCCAASWQIWVARCGGAVMTEMEAAVLVVIVAESVVCCC